MVGNWRLPERVKINGDGRVIPFNSVLHFCGLLLLEDTSHILRTLLKSSSYKNAKQIPRNGIQLTIHLCKCYFVIIPILWVTN